MDPEALVGDRTEEPQPGRNADDGAGPSQLLQIFRATHLQKIIVHLLECAPTFSGRQVWSIP